MRLDFLAEQILAPVPGGTGRYSAELWRALAAAAPEGWSVQAWTAWHRGRPLTAADRPARRLPLPRRGLALAWERGLPLRPPGGAVLHAPTLLSPPPGRRPLVVTVHDAVPWTHPETLTPRGARWHRQMAARVVPGADAVAVPTQAVATELARHVALPRRVVVTGAGAGRQLRPGDDAPARRARLDVPEGGYLVTVATLEPRKGLDVLLDALAVAGAALPPLVVVGQAGWGGVSPEQLAAERGLPPDAVRLLGRIPDEDLAAVLGGATALVAPSRAEGFGLPVLEAMAAGVPVVSSDDPALVEVGAGATRSVPVADAAALAGVLGEVVGDDAARAEMARAGRLRAADYSWEEAARRLWALYGELV